MVRKALCVERDLAVIWDYIAADDPEAAERCLRQIDTQFHKLAQSPFIGRERKDLAIGLRSFAVGNYVIFYQPIANGKGVEIVRVIEGHRNMTSEIFECCKASIQFGLRSRSRKIQKPPDLRPGYPIPLS